ncbi:MAG: DUF6603 domain-containing protein [Burkholderiales bacterium]
MSAKSLLQDLLGVLADLHEEAREMLGNDLVRNAIIRDLGGTPSSSSPVPQFPPAGLQSVKAYRDASEPGLEALLAAIQDFRAFHNALQAFAESLDLGGDAVAEETYHLLLDILGTNLIRLRLPKLYFWMQAFTFVEDTTSVFPGHVNGKAPLPTTLDRLFSSICDWNSLRKQSGFDNEAGIARISDQLALGGLAGLKIGNLVGLERYTKQIPGDEVLYGWDLVPGVPDSVPPTPAANTTLGRTFTIKFDKASTKGRNDDGTEQKNLVATLALLPRTQGGPGLFASLGGGVSVESELAEGWHFLAELQTVGAVSVLLSEERKFEINAPDEGSDFRGTVAIEARPDPLTGKAINLEIAKGTGLSCELFRIEGTLSKQAAQLKTQALGAVVQVSPTLFDGFLGKLMPKDGIRLNFDIGVGVASDRGSFREGQIRSAGTGGGPRPTTPPPPGVVPPPLPPLPLTEATGPGFSLRIPIGKSLGPLTVHDLQLRFGFEGEDDDRTYLLDAASSLSAKLGPVTARVDRVGLRLGVKFPKEGEDANLGLFNLDVGGLPPNGVALAVDAKGVVSGGGFLFYDRVQELYAGVMHLSLRERITVKAFGLVATRMPDGSKGFSLIVFITAENFQPIPVGMACTLRGIGGMIAINRTFNEDAMREGLKNKTLPTLLFPKDPIRNAPEIIRNLLTVFPAEEGSYLIGVLMKLGWFSPTLVYLDIAIMVEFGKRTRVIVLGMISALLPTKENDLVRLNMDAMGVLNLDQGSLSIDAVLVDSRLAHKFVLTGNMALRAGIGGRSRGFVMAVGGLNPRFAPPLSLPKMARITIALASGNNPRLTCEAYFAITSNTIQFGARAQLYAAAYGFSIEGDVGFDVLVQLLPFHLIADFRASVQLKRGSRNLFKLSVAGTLEGPRPLRVSGKASFEIFWCDFTIRFDKTLISGEKPPLPPAVDVLAELKRALTSADSWSTQLAQNRQHGVSLRKVTSATVLVLDPLGNLVVKQQIVPLNTSRDLDTFGGAPIAGARRFEVEARLEGVLQDVNPVQDSFAPAQFFSMTDDEKLASPSFEDMDAGVVFGSDAVLIDDGASIFAPLEFETIIIDEEGRATKEAEDRYILIADRLFEQVRFGAVAQAPIRTVGLARFRSRGVEAAVTMRPVQFAVASVQDGTVAPATKAATFAETHAILTKLNRGVATDATWQLVPMHEMTG